MSIKLLNVGCGARYHTGDGWINVDIVAVSKDVIAHDLKKGIPFDDNTFDLVYHSHVMEHIPKAEAEGFIKECIRVLKPNGVLRIVIPDLERIVRNYLRLLEKGLQDPFSEPVAADYDWIMLEMYDQTVRNESGGEMIKFLANPQLSNEEFIVERCGQEVKMMIQRLRSKPASSQYTNSEKNSLIKKIYRVIKYPQYRKSVLTNIFRKNTDSKLEMSEASRIGTFRLSGEIHQWMYDRYSLHRILSKCQMKEIVQRTSNESYIDNWSSFNLDTEKDGSIYKSDSLYMEAIKK
jgi:predicted SAM-dependent methyltransferase